MGAIVIDRLSKLGPQDSITAYCGSWRCERHSRGVSLDTVALQAQHGDLAISDLPGRLRCSVCGHRPAEIRLGWSLPPGK
jgi:hypothetical protein